MATVYLQGYIMDCGSMLVTTARWAFFLSFKICFPARAVEEQSQDTPYPPKWIRASKGSGNLSRNIYPVHFMSTQNSKFLSTNYVAIAALA